MRKHIAVRIAVYLAVVMAVVSLIGCSSWERQTFQTLAASKAVVDQAVQDYNAGSIEQSQVNHDAIDKARHAHDAAVDAFHVYIVAKEALAAAQKQQDPNATSQAQVALQAAVDSVNKILPDLADAVAQVRGLLPQKK